MEVPCRARGDSLLKPGAFTNLIRRLRRVAGDRDIATVIACAFDHRTRLLPFVYADVRIAPAGVRAVGAAMVEAGFPRTRIVLEQWNRKFRPSSARLDGRIPDIFMVSAMNIHTARAKALIRDACQIPPEHRPLIIAGGPKAIYEPWDLFSADSADPWGADIVVTGEEYVLLSALERILSVHRRGESVRKAFLRCRDRGLLDSVSGLVYSRGPADGVADQLVNTGTQQLLGDLDELPHPALGYGLLEPPGNSSALAERPLAARRVRRFSPISSLVLTFGCRFSCPYCPIPAYNQGQSRSKTGPRIADEMTRLNREYGLKYFFGADDNFFNDRVRALEIAQTLARTEIDGRPLRHTVRWGTEVTVHDTLAMKDHIEVTRKAGVRALWLGVEDMTGALVKKGQTVDSTIEAFRLLSRHGISPMPMMMHHDAQPLVTFRRPHGLVNQARILRKAGAVSLQVLMLVPALGSRAYEEVFESGTAFESVAGRPVEPYMTDGNYVIASRAPRPWRKQAGILLAYLYFYNPFRFLAAVVRPKNTLYLMDVGGQLTGMLGLFRTARRTFGWLVRLWRGTVKRATKAPASPIPIVRAKAAGPDSHERPPRAAAHTTTSTD
ncbi:MAG: B12-binding domain-containing radical SAM protein [Planctomycetota bacterium]|jgi:radical SAM superfamily enzyme YgiQ (UPF0313 family)